MAMINQVQPASSWVSKSLQWNIAEKYTVLRAYSHLKCLVWTEAKVSLVPSFELMGLQRSQLSLYLTGFRSHRHYRKQCFG